MGSSGYGVPPVREQRQETQAQGCRNSGKNLLPWDRERHTNPSVGEGAVALALGHVGSLIGSGQRLHPSPESENQRTPEPSRIFDVTVQIHLY